MHSSNVELILRDGNSVEDKQFIDYPHDAVQVRSSDSSVIRCTFKHRNFSGDHGDCIQLIPEIPGVFNQQYAAAYMENVTIASCIMEAMGTDMQGVLATDGLYYNLRLLNNVINTSQHGVTLNGVLKAELSGNQITDRKGQALARFKPLRLAGGGKNGQRIWVIDFAEDYINYEPIVSDHPIDDKRTIVFNSVDIFLVNFRYEDYRKACLSVTGEDANDMASQFFDLALEYGTRTYGNNDAPAISPSSPTQEVGMPNNTSTTFSQPMESQQREKRFKNMKDAIDYYMGECEIPGAEHNPVIVDVWKSTWYDPQDDDKAWCAALLGRMLQLCGLPYTGSPRALSYINWGNPVPIHKAKPGDVMVIDYGNGRGHVGILIREDDDSYKLFGGNQKNCANMMNYSKHGLGVWHARRLKTPLLSKTAILLLLDGVGVVSGGTYIGTRKPEPAKVTTDNAPAAAINDPRGQSNPPVISVPADNVTTATVGYEPPPGYILVPENGDAALGMGLEELLTMAAFIIASLIAKAVMFRDRIRRILKQGV